MLSATVKTMGCGGGTARSRRMRAEVCLLLVAALMASGCQREGDVPRYGGRLTYNRNLPDHDLDPLHVRSLADREIAEQIYEGLLQLEPHTLEPIPCLAESWSVEDAGRTYVFTLRKGVRFQDNPCFPLGLGREVTIEDVRYSFERGIRGPKESCAWMELWVIDGAEEFRRGLTEHVRGIELRPPRTIAFHLKFPVFHFPYVLATVAGYIVPKEAVEYYGEWFGYNPVGTGPFRLLEWVPGTRLRLVRNENYWGRDRRGNPLPFLDEIVAFPMPPSGAPLELLLSGVLDFDLEERPSTCWKVRDSDLHQHFAVDSVVMLGSVLAVTNFHRDGPFQRHASLRRAFYSTFRPVEILGHEPGHLELKSAVPPALSDGPCPPFSFDWRAPSRVIRTCPPVVMHFPLGRPDVPLTEPAYRRLRSRCWRYRLAADADSCDVVYFSCQACYPDGANIFRCFYSPVSPWGYRSARFDSLYLLYLQEFDRGKRHELACELSRQLELDGVCLPLFVELNHYVWRRSMVNLELSVNPLSAHFFKYVWIRKD